MTGLLVTAAPPNEDPVFLAAPLENAADPRLVWRDDDDPCLLDVDATWLLLNPAVPAELDCCVLPRVVTDPEF